MQRHVGAECFYVYHYKAVFEYVIKMRREIMLGDLNYREMPLKKKNLYQSEKYILFT